MLESKRTPPERYPTRAYEESRNGQRVVALDKNKFVEAIILIKKKKEEVAKGNKNYFKKTYKKNKFEISKLTCLKNKGSIS